MKGSLKPNFPETPSEIVTGERVLRLSCLALYGVWKACPGKLLVSFYFDFTILRKKNPLPRTVLAGKTSENFYPTSSQS